MKDSVLGDVVPEDAEDARVLKDVVLNHAISPKDAAALLTIVGRRALPVFARLSDMGFPFTRIRRAAVELMRR